MDVYSVTNTSSAYDTDAYQSSIDESYDMFLSLLTTQLQNQNPTDPMDSDQITEQFLNYSSIEQQVMTNDMLATMLTLTQQLQNGTPTDYLGQEVTLASTTAELKDSSASWAYMISDDVDSVTLTVTDADGESVYSQTIDNPSTGLKDFDWNGQSDEGGQLEDGLYNLSVSATIGDQTGTVTDIRTSGVVDNVDWSSGNYLLSLGNLTVSSSQVMSVGLAD